MTKQTNTPQPKNKKLHKNQKIIKWKTSIYYEV